LFAISLILLSFLILSNIYMTRRNKNLYTRHARRLEQLRQEAVAPIPVERLDEPAQSEAASAANQQY
jgi:hypothetical protein